MSGLTFDEAETLAEVLVAHGMDDFHDDHHEWTCRNEVYAAVERIIDARLAAVEALADEWAVLADYIDDPDSTPDQRARSKAGVIAAAQLRAALARGVGGAGTGEA